MSTVASPAPDTLPARGYSVDKLSEYIFRQLGSPTWNVELSKQQVLDCIQDALNEVSIWLPPVIVGNLQLVRGRHTYLEGQDMGQGVARVEFVEPNPVPTEIFYGNLINPAPLFKVGVDEYDTFLRWRKTWQRVTSIKPDWYWDEPRQVLYIHNPIERYQAGIFAYGIYKKTEELPLMAANWAKEYSLERSRYLYGEILAKYGGAIPGPLKDIQLDAAKRDKAEARLEKLKEKLQNMQSGAGMLDVD